jgi:fibronectin-binding autotransporter adhesin
LSGDGDVTTGGSLSVQAGSFSGAIGGAGGLTKSGAGTLALSGTNTYAGGTNLNAGTLAVTSDAALGATSAGLTFDGGTVRFDMAFNLGSSRAITLNAGGGTFNTNGIDTTINQAITGAGALTKTGAGMLALGGTNTYTGGTTVSGGTIAIASETALGATSGALTFDGGTVRFNHPFSVSSSRPVTLNAGGGTFFTNTFGVVINWPIGGSGGLVKTGVDTLQLANAANSYSGGTTIAEGTLVVASDAVLGDSIGGISFADGNALFNAATLRFDAPVTVPASRTITLLGELHGQQDDYETGTIDTNGFDVTMNGPITAVARW